MTGLGFDTLFGVKWDEQYSDFVDPGRRAIFCDMAVNFRFMKSTRMFQQTSETSTDLFAFIKTAITIPTAGNLIDASPTSTDIPGFKELTNMLVTYEIGDKTYTNKATPLLQTDKYNYYGCGTVFFPVYEYNNRNFVVHPVTYACARAAIDYIAVPEYIDLTDNTTQLPYEEEWLDSLVLLMISLCDGTFRDYEGFSQTQLETRITQ